MSLIYRFVSFESFVDLVQRKALHFVIPELWEDPYESYVFAAMKTEAGRKAIKEMLEKWIPENAGRHFSMLTHFCTTIFGQSWTKKPESDALWKIYSNKNRAIRIEIDLKKLEELENVKAYEVTYVEKLDLAAELKALLKKDGKELDIHKILCTKRKAFEHEEEVRLLTDIDMSNLDKSDITQETTKLVKSGLKAVLDMGEINQALYNGFIKQIDREIVKTKYISFKHIENFINSVMLHPLSPTWFDKTLETYCELNSIKYIGKSQLYDFHIK